VNWTSSAQYRRLGSRLPADPAVRVPTRPQEATVTVAGLSGPWLPGQARLVSTTGVHPLVDEVSGTLLCERVAPGLRYGLHWTAPDLRGRPLGSAQIELHPAGDTRSLGGVPPAVIDLATVAVHGLRPSFEAALLLEQYLRQHYRLAAGEHLPTGHGWPQIVHFLDGGGGPGGSGSIGGTSEQFATAYVVLARSLGIPARLVVGFGQPSRPEPDGSYAVRNGDALAWPEVAVAGVGWVPLDPRGTTRGPGNAAAGSALAAATLQARQQLPPPEQIGPQRLPASRPPGPRPLGSAGQWPVVLGASALAGLLGWLLGIPLVKATRHRMRRRRSGRAGVLAAWLEARDRLRDHGVAVGRGMTVRDVGHAARPLRPSRPAVHALHRLAGLVDASLWSGEAVGPAAADDAWQSAGTVRRDLARRSVVARVSGALSTRSLRAPR